MAVILPEVMRGNAKYIRKNHAIISMRLFSKFKGSLQLLARTDRVTMASLLAPFWSEVNQQGSK